MSRSATVAITPAVRRSSRPRRQSSLMSFIEVAEDPALNYFDDPQFHEPDAVDRIMVPLPRRSAGGMHAPNPSPLDWMLAEQPLPHVEQVACFHRMNFCKFMACQETDHTRRAAWKAKAAEAMQLLVLTNQRLVAWTIKRYHSKTLRPSEDVRDLIAYGNLALQNAVELFDYHVGGRFTTYAVTAIDRRCRRELQRDRQRWSNRTIQFSDESDDETHSSLHIGQMPDGDESHPTDSISNRAQVAMLMKHLTQRHREIVMAYFGLNGPSQSTEQLARRLKLSRTRVSQIVNTALKKLRTVGSIVPGNAFPKTSIGECKGLPKVAPAAYE